MLYFTVMESPQYPSGTHAYLPFLYVIWSDDLLSASELEVIHRAISSDKELPGAARKLLLGWINPDTPPSAATQKHWRELIRESGASYREETAYPLSEFSSAVGKALDTERETPPDFQNLEQNLGIQPNHYRHVFEQYRAPRSFSEYYDGQILAQHHLGKAYSVYSSLDSLWKQEDFRWEIQRNKEAHRQRVSRQVKHLASAGHGALAYPEGSGGKNDMPSYAAVFENLVFLDGSLCVKFGVQFGLFGGSIEKLGSEKHRKAYLGKAGTLELPGCFAMTETRHGSNVRGIHTTATYLHESRELVINTPGPDDNKEYIGNALEARMATVFAQLIVGGKRHGVHAVLVPLRNASGEVLPGIRVEDNGYKLGLNGVDNGKIWFREVRVPVDNLLDRYGGINAEGKYTSELKNPNKRFFTMLGTLVGGRICVGKGALAGAKMALGIAVRYALRRRQFNDSKRMQEDLIMDYPSHQLRLIPRLASCYVYQAALDEQMENYQQLTGGDTQKLEAQVAGLKAIITDFANDAIQESREACGGKGYLLENRIADLRSDIDIFTTFEGDNTVLLQLAAKGRLTDFRTAFNSDDFFGVLRLLRTQAARRLGAINPVYVNKTDREHLYNPAFHQHAFEYRTARLTYTLALRIRDYIKKGLPAYQAYLKVQAHFLALGRAYSEEIAYLSYRRVCEGITDEKHRALFDRLGALHALERIAADMDWYFEQGYVGKRKSKAIKRRVERLTTELRPHVASLVAGFAIPEELMQQVPIARDH